MKEQSKYKLLDANTKGTINENNAINILLENGFSIFKPITIGHETDFLILGETQLARIQVKTAIYDEKTKRYRCPLKAKSGKDGSRSAYKEESTDFFLVICPGSKSYYCFPLYVGLVTNFANLYPDRIKQYQKQAHDFEDWKNSTDCINEFLLQGKKRRTITEGNMIPNVTEEARFTHKKNWKDWEIKVLKILVENKIKYKSIANLLNRSYEGVLQKAIKLNIAGGKVSTNEIDDTQESHLKDITSNISSRTMGVISENTIINQLALRGLDVFIPCKTNDRVDAVIIDGSNFAKLQIKGGGYSKKEKSYGAELSTHNRKIRKLYSTDEIDFFLIYCRPWEDVYVIPRTATGKSLKIRLYPNRQKYDPESGYEHYKNKFNLLFQFIGKSQEQDF